ncbi:hypothetical protein CDAR_89531 [Caerostris darwini]|uniref:Uncharacterized protein n=1 Tax=Caerostris darwini TaxID=1538125 RepID=A0AAV4N3L9_9ARAC|nr:hypothetical protein CDAR_89531 [Caerostris darwini]
MSQFLVIIQLEEAKSISLNEDPALLEIDSSWGDCLFLGLSRLETLSQFLVIIQLEDAKSISLNEDPALLEIVSSWGCLGLRRCHNFWKSSSWRKQSPFLRMKILLCWRLSLLDVVSL